LMSEDLSLNVIVPTRVSCKSEEQPQRLSK
jgi:hypothetical protein